MAPLTPNICSAVALVLLVAHVRVEISSVSTPQTPMQIPS